MDTTTIREAVRRRPFKSFLLRMNDGREFRVPHPEYVAVSPTVVVVIDATTNAAIWLEPMLIASLENIETSASEKAD